MSFNNRIALVTGATGGIGTAICRDLADKGVKVIAAYHTKKKGEHWQKVERESGYQYEIAPVDVENYDSCATMINQVQQKIGPIDIVVNNAGITRDGTLRKMSKENWDLVIQTNLNSLFNITQNILNSMLERKYGRIINISSVNGQKGQFGQCNYAAAKAGIHGFTKSLAQEVAAKGITVNTISPGYIATDMVNAMPENIQQKIIATIPVGRFGESSEIARMVSFIADDDSGFITGADFSLNGGMHMY